LIKLEKSLHLVREDLYSITQSIHLNKNSDAIEIQNLVAKREQIEDLYQKT
jgi:hypothetical protein